MGREAHGHSPRLGAGPRPASAPVPGMERARIGSPEEALLDLVAHVLGPRQNVAALQAPGLQRSDRHQRHRDLNDTNEIGGQFDFTLTASRAGT